MKINPATLIDGYKTGHRNQYCPGTELVFSNLTPRKSYRKDKVDGVVFFGLQYFLKEYLIKQWNENFFSKPKDEVLAKFTRRINNYLGPNNVGEQHISDLHDLGYLPILVMALKEGSTVPYKVAPMVIFSDPSFKGQFWLTNYLETIWSTTIWLMSTTATSAKQFRGILEEYANLTSDNIDFVKFQSHNFSYRGCHGHEAACMIDAGHLTSFVGSDTIPGADFLEEYYDADSDKELISCSVNASEHSVMSSYGKLNELEAFRHLIEDVYPNGFVSIVSDTFDYWKVISEYTVTLKDKILARDGKVIFRPDSGDNVDVICGIRIRNILKDKYIQTLEDAVQDARDEIVDAVRENTPHGECGHSDVTDYFRFENVVYKIKVRIDWNRHDKQYYYIDGDTLVGYEVAVLTPEQKGTIECLWDIFGGTVNSKGFKSLNTKVGAILGDGVNLDVLKNILFRLKEKGFASTNMVFGTGSFFYSYCTRDTDGWAVKSTYCEVNGEPRNIFKDPKTDIGGLKKSAKGLVAVYKDENGQFYQKDECSWDEVFNCEYELVFDKGILKRNQSISEIRKLINNNF